MKNLLVTILFLTSLNSFADVVLPKKCSELDLAKLQSARNLDLPTLEVVVADDIVPNIKTCEVTSPLSYYPTVCGQKRTQLSFYKIITNKGNVVNLTTSISTISCGGIRSYLQLRDLSIKPKQ